MYSISPPLLISAYILLLRVSRQLLRGEFRTSQTHLLLYVDAVRRFWCALLLYTRLISANILMLCVSPQPFIVESRTFQAHLLLYVGGVRRLWRALLYTRLSKSWNKPLCTKRNVICVSGCCPAEGPTYHLSFQFRNMSLQVSTLLHYPVCVASCVDAFLNQPL